MKQKSNMEPTESTDQEDGERSCEKKAKNPGCERCWIFKRNKNFIQSKGSHGCPSPNRNVNGVDRYDEHKRFLARLLKYQQSLPHDKVEQPVVVNQIVPDYPDIKNLFVNNVCRIRRDFNLKAMEKQAIEQKAKEPINLTTRSLRLNRKCKNNVIYGEDDKDFQVGENVSFFKLKEGKNTNILDLLTKDCNGHSSSSSNSTSTSNKKVKLGMNSTTPLDELLGDVVMEPAKTKKKKLDMKSDDASNTNAIKKIMGQFTENDSATTSFQRKAANANNTKKENALNVIEIDGENEEKKPVSSNGEEINQNPKVSCPMCNKYFSSDAINDHAYTCQGPQTQTRSRLKNDSQDNTMGNFNPSVWENACKGLGELKDESKVVSKKPKRPVEQVDISFDEKERKTSATIQPLKRTISKISESASTYKSEKDTGKSGFSKPPIKSGYTDLSQSTQDLLEGYAKTIHKVNGKNLPAKKLRTFGGHQNEEDELVKCGRCDQYISDDQLKAHTDNCLEKSVLLE